MTKDSAGKIERLCLILIVGLAILSFASLWSEDLLGIDGFALRIGSQIGLLIAAAGYFFVRAKTK